MVVSEYRHLQLYYTIATVFSRGKEGTFTATADGFQYTYIDYEVISIFLLIFQMLRKTFMYASIKDPVAFVSRNSRATHNRLLVFTEKCAGHYNNNDVYHVFQVLVLH